MFILSTAFCFLRKLSFFIYTFFVHAITLFFSSPNDGIFRSVIENLLPFVVYYYYNEIAIPKMDYCDLKKGFLYGKIQKKQD